MFVLVAVGGICVAGCCAGSCFITICLGFWIVACRLGCYFSWVVLVLGLLVGCLFILVGLMIVLHVGWFGYLRVGAGSVLVFIARCWAAVAGFDLL